MPDRSSLGWQSVMDSRYYLYDVHTSRTFLHAPTLAARLYLVLMRLMARQYVATFRQLESCDVDTDFTAEERWVFAQLARSASDQHPDAHACRLRASLAVLHSNNVAPWETHLELDRYLAKLAHVSAACRIAVDDELALLYSCKVATPAIKARLACLRAVQTGDARAIAAVALETKPPRLGGQPWLKLQQLSASYLEQYGTHLTMLRFKAPSMGSDALVDAKCVELVWNDLILADEESG